MSVTATSSNQASGAAVQISASPAPAVKKAAPPEQEKVQQAPPPPPPPPKPSINTSGQTIGSTINTSA